MENKFPLENKVEIFKKLYETIKPKEIVVGAFYNVDGAKEFGYDRRTTITDEELLFIDIVNELIPEHDRFKSVYDARNRKPKGLYIMVGIQNRYGITLQQVEATGLNCIFIDWFPNVVELGIEGKGT